MYARRCQPIHKYGYACTGRCCRQGAVLLEIVVLGRLETSLLTALGKAGRVSAIENPALVPVGDCDLLVVDQRAELRDSHARAGSIRPGAMPCGCTGGSGLHRR